MENHFTGSLLIVHTNFKNLTFWPNCLRCQLIGDSAGQCRYLLISFCTGYEKDRLFLLYNLLFFDVSIMEAFHYFGLCWWHFKLRDFSLLEFRVLGFR